jgi:hypothetical protein
MNGPPDHFTLRFDFVIAPAPGAAALAGNASPSNPTTTSASTGRLERIYFTNLTVEIVPL